jgi:hypothetical protein
MAAEAAYVVGNRRTRRRLCNIATQCNIIYSTEWWKPGELLVAPRNQQQNTPNKPSFKHSLQRPADGIQEESQDRLDTAGWRREGGEEHDPQAGLGEFSSDLYQGPSEEKNS